MHITVIEYPGAILIKIQTSMKYTELLQEETTSCALNKKVSETSSYSIDMGSEVACI